MLRFLGLVGCLLSLPTFAETFNVQIKEVDFGKGEEETLVFLSNGKVAKVQAGDSLANELNSAVEEKSWFNVTLDDNREIVAVQSAEAPVTADELSHLKFNRITAYQPTIIPSLKKAHEYFKEMRRGSLEDSQCYNRAHVWSYEWKMKHDINSMKMWVFFSNKYIRRYNFEWWFHVAPFVYVDESTGVMERVMDFKYSYAPQYPREWTNYFMQNDPKCRIITAYSEYEKTRDNNEHWCYLMKTNMFYYQPLDMFNLEKEGLTAQKTFFMDWEVRNAHRQAFGLTPQF